MKVLGMVTEYNPFHNGHLYHLEKSKEITGCDYSVCIMSGNYIQRGSPALTNKMVRTEMALKNGVDLVIELPVYFALSSAEFFASYSIKLLDSLGVIDAVCFGSELGKLGPLFDIANILSKQPEEFKTVLDSELKKGVSFATARTVAVQKILNNEEISNIISKPNNILGIEYLKGLINLNSKITPYTIVRHKSEYNSKKTLSNIASATAIRDKLESGNIEDIINLVPKNTYEILQNEISGGRAPIFSGNFENSILTLLRRESKERLLQVNDVTEGLENRIKSNANNCGTIDMLIRGINTKRYTQTRIQRILFGLLLDLKKEIFDSINSQSKPLYIRILGFTSKGKELLPRIKKSGIPIVTAPHDFLKSCTELQREMLLADIRATDIYNLAYPNPSARNAGSDFTDKIISVD